jgi:hypothetical protein
MVSPYMPTAAAPALTVSVELPPAVTEDGLNEALAPAGRPLIDSATVCAEPAVTAVEIVDVPLVFCASDRLFGEAEIEKSFVTAGLIVKVMLVVWVALVPVPVTTTV